jgi:hypothetical protein
METAPGPGHGPCLTSPAACCAAKRAHLPTALLRARRGLAGGLTLTKGLSLVSRWWLPGLVARWSEHEVTYFGRHEAGGRLGGVGSVPVPPTGLSD